MPDNQCYFNGDFYQCLAETDLGESPGTTPAKWARIRIMAKWRFALTRLTYAHLLSLDGQTDKATVERNVAYGRERLGLDDLIRAEATAEENNLDQARGLGFAHPPTSGNNGVIRASVIFDDAYRLIGWDASQVDSRDFNDARSCFSQALQEIWEGWWWRQAMQCQRLQFATTLDLTAPYDAGQTAYDPENDVYLVALRTCTGADTDSFEEYDPCEPTSLPAWDAAADYSAGDQFSYAGTDYQCWTDFSPDNLTITGTGIPELDDVIIVRDGTFGGKPRWTSADGAVIVRWVSPNWHILVRSADFSPAVPATHFSANEDVDLPSGVTGGWTAFFGITTQPEFVTVLPTSTDFFVPLQGWRPLLPWTNYGGVQQEPFGPVRSVSKFDPRISCNAQQFQLDVRQDGTRVRALTETHPWVWARRVTPIITGDEWSASTTYEAVPASELVFGTTDDSFLEVEGGLLQVFI